MNELVLPEHQILVEQGEFELIGYEELKKQVDELGKHLLTVEVTPENIQDNKKLVAHVRKITDSLNKERIEFKKQYMAPVKKLEDQVKELTTTVGQYEAVIRKQIRDIEEQERDAKEQEIRSIFELRSKAYDTELFPFSKFIKPKYLNKSTSINKVETEMVEWFENRSQDLQTLSEYALNNDLDRELVLNHYLVSNDFRETIDYYTNAKEKRKDIETGINKISRKKQPTKDRYVYFKISEIDKDKVTSLLELSGVEFEIK